MKFIDIGANLTDPMFRGIYGGARKHPDDFEILMERAWKQGMDKIIITVGQLKEADEALAIAKADDRFSITMGCHPTRCNNFQRNPDDYYARLRQKIIENRSKVVAIGECGLDYDRLKFCQKETQKPYFEKQLNLAAEFQLPLFLHCRNSYADFVEILHRNHEKLSAGGVVHSFDGTLEEAQTVLALGDNFYIGLNGCSLKTAEQLEVIKQLPDDRLMLETDCPWCSIRTSHASHKYVQTKFDAVKRKDRWSAEKLVDSRCEPCQIQQVLEVIAAVKEQPIERLADIYYENTLRLFFNSSRTKAA